MLIQNNKGSISIEAAIALPLFLFVLLFFIYIGNIYTVRSVIYEGCIETAEYMSEYAYFTNCFEKAEVTDYPIVALRFSEYVDQEALLEKYVVGGKRGISFIGSRFPDEEGFIDLKATYYIHISVPLLGAFKHMYTERIKQRAYIGRTSSLSEGAADRNNRFVYVAENAVVYHDTRSCTYLLPSIRSTSSSVAKRQGYFACKYCGKNISGRVYVTTYGDCYHSSRKCSRLKRTVFMKRLSEVNLPPCSKCAQ